MSDLISRQEAIDDLMGKDPSQIWDTADIEVWVNALPSAQRWIPCTERPPEKSDKYLVTALDGIRRIVTLASYHPRTKQWSLAGRAAHWRATAWQPLPAAYREENGNEKTD